jgi:hypothetical protein
MEPGRQFRESGSVACSRFSAVGQFAPHPRSLSPEYRGEGRVMTQMTSIQRIQDSIAPLRQQLIGHDVYGQIRGLDALRRFMELHVYAVWDFMSLLKTLQRRICCVEVPWTPPLDPAGARLVNEIVLAEESDEDGAGGVASHFDLYLRSMEQAGADVGVIERFVGCLRRRESLGDAIRLASVPDAGARFIRRTFDVIETGDLPAIASAFTFGREDLLPDVFRRIVEEQAQETPAALQPFLYYLDRHISLDGDEHGPKANQLLMRLCGDDPRNWAAAEAAAVASLKARLELWDAMRDEIAGGG